MQVNQKPSQDQHSARPGASDLVPGFRHIIVAPDYMHGEPALLGLRLRIRDILKMLASGWTEERLREQYDIDEDTFYEIYRFASESLIKQYGVP
jgi:uncharacterized protein (DUF433 family)